MNNRYNNWQVAKRFVDEDSDWAVIVQRDLSVFWPKFSIQVGRMIPDEEGVPQLRPFIPIFLDRLDVGRVTLRYPLEKLEFLIQDAEKYILEVAQEEELKRAIESAERKEIRKNHQQRKYNRDDE